MIAGVGAILTLLDSAIPPTVLNMMSYGSLAGLMVTAAGYGAVRQKVLGHERNRSEDQRAWQRQRDEDVERSDKRHDELTREVRDGFERVGDRIDTLSREVERMRAQTEPLVKAWNRDREHDR